MTFLAHLTAQEVPMVSGLVLLALGVGIGLGLALVYKMVRK